MPPKKLNHIPALDGLRGIAILLVLTVHIIGLDPEAHRNSVFYWVCVAIRAGWLGVNLFFVLSGFLITGILCDAKGTPGALRNFYARRVLRIFPLYYGVLFVLFAIGPFVSYFGSPEIASLVPAQGWFWAYGTNILIARDGPVPILNHFWSLAVEEHFYLVWPFLVLWLSNKTVLKVCGIVIVGALALRIWLVAVGFRPIGVYVLTPCRMDDLAIGAAIAIVARMPGGWDRLRKLARYLLPASIVAIIVVAAAAGNFDYENRVVQSVGYSAIALFFGALLVLVNTNRGLLKWLCEISVLRFFGKYSYGLYVYHIFVGYLIGSMGVSPKSLSTQFHSYAIGGIAYIVLNLGASIGVAVASWYLFENPILKLKRHFEYRGRVPVPVPASPS